MGGQVLDAQAERGAVEAIGLNGWGTSQGVPSSGFAPDAAEKSA